MSNIQLYIIVLRQTLKTTLHINLCHQNIFSESHTYSLVSRKAPRKLKRGEDEKSKGQTKNRPSEKPHINAAGLK